MEKQLEKKTLSWEYFRTNLSLVCCRICYTDSIGVQEDQYPPNIAVKVNQSYCHVPVYDYPSQNNKN